MWLVHPHVTHLMIVGIKENDLVRLLEHLHRNAVEDVGNGFWPEPVPYIFNGVAMQMLQQPDKIIFLYPNDHQVRYVRMNQPHPAQVTPSWYGDSEIGRASCRERV